MTATIFNLPNMDKRPLDQLPNRIREWRKVRQLSLRSLGEQAGIAYGHLSRMETGSSTMNDAWLERLSAVLKIDAADLLPLAQGGLTADERLAVDTLRSVTPANRQSLMAMIASQQPFRQELGQAAISTILNEMESRRRA
jgi:transcriptional regulator with XRE-family HTH domain